MNETERFLKSMDSQQPTWVTSHATQIELRTFSESVIRKMLIPDAYAILRKSVGERLLVCSRAQHNAQREHELEIQARAQELAAERIEQIRTKDWADPSVIHQPAAA